MQAVEEDTAISLAFGRMWWKWGRHSAVESERDFKREIVDSSCGFAEFQEELIGLEEDEWRKNESRIGGGLS